MIISQWFSTSRCGISVVKLLPTIILYDVLPLLVILANVGWFEVVPVIVFPTRRWRIWIDSCSDSCNNAVLSSRIESFSIVVCNRVMVLTPFICFGICCMRGLKFFKSVSAAFLGRLTLTGCFELCWTFAVSKVNVAFTLFGIRSCVMFVRFGKQLECDRSL